MVEAIRSQSSEPERRPGLEAAGGRLAWWFCQGYFHAGTGEPTRFVSSFFRGHDSERPGLERHYLFVSLLPPGASRPLVRCRADRALLESFQEHLERREREFGGLDRFMAEAVLRELAEYGPPARLELAEAPFVSDRGRLSVAWEDFGLRWNGQRIELSFREPQEPREPGRGRECRFALSSDLPVVDLAALGAPRLENTSYLTLPRMSLTGSVGEEPVIGEAWFDHQDTDPSEWMLEGDGRSSRMLGWEWLGANLDDGSDWVVIQHRDMKRREVVDRYAVVRSPGEPPRLLRRFTAEPLGFWVSPETHVRYPVAWRFQFPEIDAELVFEPLVEAQEVPMVGLLRAIWEGAGRVEGRLGRRPLSGRGRLELKGYGYIFDFKQYTRVFVERIDQLLEAFLPRQFDQASMERLAGPPVWRHDPEIQSEVLARPVWDLLDRGGKHWRPMLGFLLLETLGVPSRPYEALLANVIELNHTGALIVDDIEDDSLVRRGEECIHRRYGTDVAINTGTALYFLSYLLLESELGLSDRQLVGLYRIVVDFQVKAHLGQGQDIGWTRAISPAWLRGRPGNGFSDQVLQMYAMKTGAATQGTAEAACVIAEADRAVRAGYASFGRTFGVSFQLIDDVLNFSTSPTWTKSRGEDLASGKPTWVLVRALEMLDGEERGRLVRILSDPELRAGQEGRQEGIRLVESSGALEEGRRLARRMLETEWRSFSKHARPSEPKTMLRMLTTGLLEFEQDY